MNLPMKATAGSRPRRTWPRLRPAGPRAVLTALALLAGGLAGPKRERIHRAAAARK